MSNTDVSYSDHFQPGHLAITTNTSELLGTGFFINAFIIGKVKQALILMLRTMILCR